MTQLIITIDDLKRLPDLKRSIASMQGVTSVKVYHSVPGTRPMAGRNIEGISRDVKELIGLASSLSDTEVASDARLSYILGK